MKGFFNFILCVVVILGAISAFWWLYDGSTPGDQIEYVRYTFIESVENSGAGNTAESASKLGKVLKNNFNDAQDVYNNSVKADN